MVTTHTFTVNGWLFALAKGFEALNLTGKRVGASRLDSDTRSFRGFGGGEEDPVISI